MTPQFERCFKGLRREKGGAAAMAARKADEFIKCLMNGSESSDREKFSFTWNGEYRIKNCKKIDLVGAYRLVMIQKENLFVLLYVGSHDDCFRWIERNKGLSYEVDHTTHAISVVQDAGQGDDALPKDVLEEKKFVECYEQKLMKACLREYSQVGVGAGRLRIKTIIKYRHLKTGGFDGINAV